MIVAPIIDGGKPTKLAISIALSTETLERTIIATTPTKNLVPTKITFPVFWSSGVSLTVVSPVLRETVTPKYANSVRSTIPKMGPRLPRWTMKSVIFCKNGFVLLGLFILSIRLESATHPLLLLWLNLLAEAQ